MIKVNGIGEKEKRGDLEHIYWVGTSRLVAPSQRVIKKVLQENEKYIYIYIYMLINNNNNFSIIKNIITIIPSKF